MLKNKRVFKKESVMPKIESAVIRIGEYWLPKCNVERVKSKYYIYIFGITRRNKMVVTRKKRGRGNKKKIDLLLNKDGLVPLEKVPPSVLTHDKVISLYEKTVHRISLNLLRDTFNATRDNRALKNEHFTLEDVVDFMKSHEVALGSVGLVKIEIKFI
jgi:hypothetical protein